MKTPEHVMLYWNFEPWINAIFAFFLQVDLKIEGWFETGALDSSALFVCMVGVVEVAFES